MAWVGKYAADGSWNVSVVPGNAYTGFFANDGSVNVVISPGGSFVGANAPCGGLYITKAPAPSIGGLPFQAPDGSLNVSQTPFTNGGQKVTVVSGVIP